MRILRIVSRNQILLLSTFVRAGGDLRISRLPTWGAWMLRLCKQMTEQT